MIKNNFNNSIKVLDCTLRDGGYCNSWLFGKENISKIIKYLVESNVEIIECGFITQKSDSNENVSLYRSFYDVSKYKPKNVGRAIFVAMINYGEYNMEEVPECNENTIDGVRVAFHKKHAEKAMEYCKQLSEKGYKVFVQPMVSMNYTEEEFVNLIKKANEFSPYAFYIVDTFGSFKPINLKQRFSITEKYLNKNIRVGLHSHNNSQLAFSNAQAFVSYPTNHDIIVDCSIMGMGRGAGNLNTELFLEFLNESRDKDYFIHPILTAIDEVVAVFYNKHYWGYSLPNYLSAKHDCHPNYASYLADKQTLTIDSINDIFSLFDEDKKNNYDESYIEELYMEYMKRGKENESLVNGFYQEVSGKEVLLLAPGKSSSEELEKIRQYIKEKHPIVISVNFVHKNIEPNYVFISNLRRYNAFQYKDKYRVMVTSNIKTEKAYIVLNYADLLNEIEGVRDNSALMLIKLLTSCNVKRIMVAGLDGYTYDIEENFADNCMSFPITKTKAKMVNNGIEKVLKECSKKVQIKFLTQEKNVKLS